MYPYEYKNFHGKLQRRKPNQQKEREKKYIQSDQQA
jgi:hypothetical protein